jgi:glycosyltransferase involved in cell wall biosynthesis
MRAVHQLLPVLNSSDAIGSAALRLRALLQSMGYRSDIYADLIDRPLRRQAQPVHRLSESLDRDDAVIYHLSLGSPLAAMMRSLRCKRIVYYHNITPPETVEMLSASLAHRLRWGRSDLMSLAPACDLCIAPSTFSVDELTTAGARQAVRVRLPVDLQRLSPREATVGSPPIVLFVGRMAPHKGQDVLIRMLAALRAVDHFHCRLVLAGAATVPGFSSALRGLAQQLGVEHDVEIADANVNDAQLGDLYASASLFACASEHEGFCVPLLEAMAFSVPVLAYAAAAVPETLGRAGVLVTNRDPLVWAELARWLVSDRGARRTLTAAGRSRLEEFTDKAVAGDIGVALELLTMSPR